MSTTTETPADNPTQNPAPAAPPSTTRETIEAAVSLLITMSYLVKMQTTCIDLLNQGNKVPDEMLLNIKLEQNKLSPGLRMMINRLKAL